MSDLFGWQANPVSMLKGDSLELVLSTPHTFDLIVTDPPYAFGGTGDEHAISATVAVVLREAARRLSEGSFMVVMCAASWRSTAYMVESVRGLVEPVRIGTWNKPACRTKTRTPGWAWASVNAVVFRKGKAREIPPCDVLDYIVAEPVMNGRRAQLPPTVADWMVRPYAVPGGLMLDPFAGSGAILAAAERAGMNAIGFEKAPIEVPAHAITCDLDEDCSCGLWTCPECRPEYHRKPTEAA